MPDSHDTLVVGAGFAGSVVERLASQLGQRVPVIDRRGHVGGHTFDYVDGQARRARAPLRAAHLPHQRRQGRRLPVAVHRVVGLRSGTTPPPPCTSRRVPALEGDPYYPNPNDETRALYRRYEALAAEQADRTV